MASVAWCSDGLDPKKLGAWTWPMFVRDMYKQPAQQGLVTSDSQHLVLSLQGMVFDTEYD